MLWAIVEILENGDEGNIISSESLESALKYVEGFYTVLLVNDLDDLFDTGF